MIVRDVLFALIVAFLLHLIFSRGFRRVGPWTAFWSFFVVFLAAWVGGLWMRPWGPSLWGVNWAPFAVIGFFAALLLAASSPDSPRKRDRDEEQNASDATDDAEAERTAVAATVAIGWFFWMLVFALAVAVVMAYLLHNGQWNGLN